MFNNELSELDEKIRSRLDPKIVAYIDAKTDYYSEVDHGYIHSDLVKAEVKLKKAMLDLLE